tara:strand:+ start:755 stop:2806 length:2052 start_codon:yes stop_codon:yes gene_type:complete
MADGSTGFLCAPLGGKESGMETVVMKRRKAAVETNRKLKDAEVEDSDDDGDFDAGMTKRAERGETDAEAKARHSISTIKAIVRAPDGVEIAESAPCIRTSTPSLKEHQVTVARHLTAFKGVAVAASVGTGKTMLAVASGACALKNVPDVKRVLTLTPAALKTNFEAAIRQYYRLSEKAPLPEEWAVQSYESFESSFHDVVHAKDKGPLQKRMATTMKDAMLICDEAHALSGEIVISRSSKTAGKVSHVKAFLALLASEHAARCLAMTGTPVVNVPFDACNLATMARGDGRFLSKGEFKALCLPENAKQFKTFFRGTFFFYWVKDSPDFPTLRYAKEHDTRDKKPVGTRIVLNDAQLRAYESIEHEGEEAVKMFGKDADTSAFYNGLRRAANSIDALKTQRIVDILTTLPKEKRRTVISSQFIEYGIQNIQKALDNAKISYVTLTGKESGTKKGQAAIDAFKSGKVEVMLLSMAGVQGLDFKGVRTVILTEPFWTSAMETQTVGRARRYKSHLHLPENQRDVTVYRLHLSKTKNGEKRDAIAGREETVDEIVMEMSESKDEENIAFLEKLRRLEVKEAYPAYRGAKPVRIPLDPNHHVGTDTKPYRTADSAKTRREAIRAGIEERVERKEMKARDAVVQVKRRLNVLRVYSKHKPHCEAFESDMQWIDATFLPKAKTRQVCSKT